MLHHVGCNLELYTEDSSVYILCVSVLPADSFNPLAPEFYF